MNALATADTLVDTAIVLNSPYGKFYVDPLDLSSHAAMRAEQLREVLIALSNADQHNLMLRLAKPLGGEVYDRTKIAINDESNREGLIAASKFASEVLHFLLTIQHEDGPGVMLWLAQQLCDEVSGMLAGMAVAQVQS